MKSAAHIYTPEDITEDYLDTIATSIGTHAWDDADHALIATHILNNLPPSPPKSAAPPTHAIGKERITRGEPPPNSDEFVCMKCGTMNLIERLSCRNCGDMLPAFTDKLRKKG